MHKIAVLEDRILKTSKSLNHLTDQALLNHVYSQGSLVFFSSLFCAVLVYIGLSFKGNLTNQLTLWAELFLAVTAYRIGISILYQRKQDQASTYTWRNLYIFGAFLGGLTWGAAAVLFLPESTLLQKTLLIFMLAGITSGSVPITAAIPQASIAFLVMAIAPFILLLAYTNDVMLQFFDVALALYLVYSIIVSLKTYRLIRNSLVLQFEKSSLLEDVYHAKLELEKINKKLHIAATHDPLTQLANRTLFKNTLGKTIIKSRANNKIFALLYLDLDNFKMINDRYGHHAGDIILLTVSERLKGYFGNNVVIARLGGDEFIVLVTNIDYPRQIKYIAGEVCRLLSLPMKVDQQQISITVSIGISLYPKEGKDIEGLLRTADKSMYYVKQHGGGSFYLREPEAASNLD